MKVTIECSDISNYGKQIIDYSNDFKDQINKFTSLIEEINSIWDGADALKYINTMRDKYIVGLEDLRAILEDYGNYLKQVPEAYQALDEVFSTKRIEV